MCGPTRTILFYYTSCYQLLWYHDKCKNVLYTIMKIYLVLFEFLIFILNSKIWRLTNELDLISYLSINSSLVWIIEWRNSEHFNFFFYFRNFFYSWNNIYIQINILYDIYPKFSYTNRSITYIIFLHVIARFYCFMLMEFKRVNKRGTFVCKRILQNWT